MKSIIFLSVVYCTFAVPLEDDPLQEFVKGNQKFSSGVYKEVLKQQPGNFIVSPLSAEIVLALTNEGAKGTTYEELATTLSFPSTKEKTRKALKTLLPSLSRSDDELKLLSANKIYAAEDLKIEDDFRSTATDIYNAGVDNVDFSKNIETSDAINRWVEDKTNGKIKNLISSDSIDKYTKMVLVNAVYFSGKWSSEFKKSSTRKKDFFKTKDSSVKTDIMDQFNWFNYYENSTLGAKFLELPYKGNAEISMVIVLPNEKDGLASLEQTIDQVLAPQPFTWERVALQLPRFTIETKIEFAPILKELGVKKIFSKDGDLSGLSSTYEDAAVNNVIQKAYIKVAETGTEAAAATAVVHTLSISTTAVHLEKINEFHADHPFLYFIKLKEAILFAGRYTNPIA